MTGPFGHPSSDHLFSEVRDVLSKKRIFVEVARGIVFVCGGPVKKYSRSLRYRFLQYAHQEIPHLRMFLAEDAARDLTTHNEPEFVNIADFESLVAGVADCILVFPESAGSIAEG